MAIQFVVIPIFAAGRVAAAGGRVAGGVMRSISQRVAPALSRGARGVRRSAQGAAKGIAAEAVDPLVSVVDQRPLEEMAMRSASGYSGFAEIVSLRRDIRGDDRLRLFGIDTARDLIARDAGAAREAEQEFFDDMAKVAGRARPEKYMPIVRREARAAMRSAAERIRRSGRISQDVIDNALAQSFREAGARATAKIAEMQPTFADLMFR